MTTVQTQNPHYGFYGTMSRACPGFEDDLWELAMDAISVELGEMPSYVRPFLDSAAGRKFADAVTGYMLGPNSVPEAVHKAVNDWMEVPACRAMHNSVPRLVYHVVHEAVYEEELLGAY